MPKISDRAKAVLITIFVSQSIFDPCNIESGITVHMGVASKTRGQGLRSSQWKNAPLVGAELQISHLGTRSRNSLLEHNIQR